MADIFKIPLSTMYNKLKNGFCIYNGYTIIKNDLDIEVDLEMIFTPVPGEDFSICLHYPQFIKKKNGKLARVSETDKFYYYKNKNIIYYFLKAFYQVLLPEKGICYAENKNFKDINIKNVRYEGKKNND